MRTTVPLNIKTEQNKFIITVSKNEITPEYLLELLNWLQFRGNSTVAIPQKKIKKRIWNYFGSVNLHHKLDNINLRDFAYE